METTNMNIKDKEIIAPSGIMLLALLIIGVMVEGAVVFLGLMYQSLFPFVIAAFMFLITLFAFMGIHTISPNEVVVVQLFGKYVGTITNTGLVFINPLANKKTISKKLENFSSKSIKVNDKSGNPIVISGMFAWKVNDAAKAVFNVENYEHFISNQVEGMLAEVASKYPYSSETDKSFRKNSKEIAQDLKLLLQEKVEESGIEVVDVRFNNFAYAVEIAPAMLKKQQAEAVVEARKTIVDGAHEMVNGIIEKIEGEKKMNFSNEDKVRLTINLMTVLVSENGTQPVVNVS